MILRRLRRLAARYGASPTFVLASATLGNPAELASRLVGLPVEAVTDDGSPRGPVSFALWEPPCWTRPPACAAAPTPSRPPGWPLPSRPGSAPCASPARADRPSWSPPSPGTGSPGWTAAWPAGSAPTGPASWPRSGASWSRAWSRAGCSGWPPPTPSSWAWTSAAWTRSCSTATRARSPRCGSRPAGPAARASRPWPCWSARTTPSTPTCCTTTRTSSGAPRGRPGRPDQPLRAHLLCAAFELPLTDRDMELFGADSARALVDALEAEGRCAAAGTGSTRAPASARPTRSTSATPAAAR